MTSTATPKTQWSDDPEMLDEQFRETKILDSKVTVSIEFGRVSVPIKTILGLSIGSVLEFPGTSGSRVKIIVNGKHMANGEVAVCDGGYRIFLTEILGVRDEV